MPELIACPSCQNKISERATTCPKCGSERQKQCMVCKKFIMIDSISCPECGDPTPFDEQLVSNKEAKKYETKITADMSDSVKQKKLSHFPLFFRGFSFHMQGISRGGIL
jgi:RNA polymerase subunit RPABC4/transcription elongation factor Spt4